MDVFSGGVRLEQYLADPIQRKGVSHSQNKHTPVPISHYHIIIFLLQSVNINMLSRLFRLRTHSQLPRFRAPHPHYIIVVKGMDLRLPLMLVLAIWPITATLDYNANHTLICSQISSGNLSANLRQLWNILILHDLDRYSFLCICPAIAILQGMFLYTYGKNENLRIKPGNIFCGLVIIQALLNILLFSVAVFTTVHRQDAPMPNSFIGFCSATSILQGFLSLIHFFYLSMFLIYTIFLFRFSLKKKSTKFWQMLHILVFCSSAIITIFLYFEEFMGLNFYGICGMTPTRKDKFNIDFPIIQMSFALIFCIIGLFTRSYFNKHMPGGESFRRKKLKESRIIFLYVTGFSIFLFLMGLIELLVNINCIQKSPLSGITVLVTIANISRLMEFVFLLVLVLMQDNFRRKFKRMLKNIFESQSSKSNSMQVEDADIMKEIQMQKLAFDQKLMKMKEKKNQIDLLLVSQIYTIISGVYIANFEYNSHDQAPHQVRAIYFQESISFQLENKSIANYEKSDRSMLQLRALSCRMILHAPRIFALLLELDGITKVYESFSIIQNVKKIWNLAEGDGGRSGEFFFFSSDNKFVLKTITVEQFDFLKRNMEFFYQHFRRNPDSLLAKIYGLYTIKGNEMQRTYRVILMKNILGCPKSQVLRVYDMKGSKYDRQVIKDISLQHQYSKMTLKDIDFMNLQGKIKINESKTNNLKEILRKDTQFLKELNLIDYSLLVVKVVWIRDPPMPTFWSPFQRIQHSDLAEQYYHIGIIDYMQKWDLQKKSEKWWKNMIGKKDVSAAEPNHYQKRFMQFVDEIVTVLAKNEQEQREYEMQSMSGSEKSGKDRRHGRQKNENVRPESISEEASDYNQDEHL